MSVAEMDTPKKRLEYIFDETSRGNGQPFLDALAENAEWTIIGSTGWSKTYRGKTAILSDLIAPLKRVLAHGCCPRTGGEHDPRWPQIRQYLLLDICFSGRTGGGGD
jgi:hypothetical protein